MSIFKSEFQPTMKRFSFLLYTLLSFVGIAFIIRALILPSIIEQVASFILGSLFLFIYIYIIYTIPTSLELNEEGIIVKRKFKDKCIPYSDIKKVFIYNEVQGDIRYFGSNGFLGYIGVMGSTAYGKYYSYVKNPKQQIFIMTKNKNYLFSCENRDTFIDELSKKI